MKQRTIPWNILNILAYVATVTVNVLANLLRFGGFTTGEVAANYPNLFTPAPITFAIWGIIYFGLAGFCLYQSGLFRIPCAKELANALGPWFLCSSLANIAWIFCWHYQKITLSMVCILVLLISLIQLTELLRGFSLPRLGTFWVKAPFSVYFGWITVAAIANFFVFLVSIGLQPTPSAAQLLTALALTAGAFIACLVITEREDPFYALPVLWAYGGIILRYRTGGFPLLLITAIVCEITLVLCLLRVLRKAKSPRR